MEEAKYDVWCDFHNCIHKKTPNPYDELDPDNICGPKDWRRLWVGARIPCKQKKQTNIT